MKKGKEVGPIPDQMLRISYCTYVLAFMNLLLPTQYSKAGQDSGDAGQTTIHLAWDPWVYLPRPMLAFTV